MFEPTVAATVVTPAEFVGPLMLLCQERRGEMMEHMALGAGRALLKCGRFTGSLAIFPDIMLPKTVPSTSYTQP